MTIDSPEALYGYWRQASPRGHDPREALEATARSKALLDLIPKEVPKGSPILEIGSGAGRNLAYLVAAGFTNVHGAEISQHAVDLMRSRFPELADIPVHVGPAEDLLREMADDSFKLAISMSTLQHIHPERSSLFDDIARIASQVLLIEGPPKLTKRRYPYDFTEIFTSRGMTPVGKPVPMSRYLPRGDGMERYRALLFKRMETMATLHDFWRQPTPDGNVPKYYIGHTGRSAALLKLISDLPKDARILEVGCNVGRNLAYLHDNGYENVTGIEINPHAVDLLRRTYPQLADREVHLGSAGDVLTRIPDDAFDIVFTMAVLEHIHPDESHVFDEMVRVGHQILAIEPRERLSHRQFPHDIPAVFGSRQMELVSETWMGEFLDDGAGEAMKRYTGYRFDRRPADGN